MKKPLLVLVPLIVGCFVFNAGFGVYLRPLLYTLTPLQRYYLGAYLASSWKTKDPAAQTDVEWIWKVKPKGKREFAQEQDLVALPATELLWQGDPLPFSLSGQAAAEGWLGVSKSMPSHVNSAQLQSILEEAFFDGEPAWRFFVQPALALSTGLLLLLLIRYWLEARRERNYWAQPVPLWWELGQKVLASSSAVVKGLQGQTAQLALPKPGAGPVIVAQGVARPEEKPALKAPPGMPLAAPVQQTVMPALKVTTEKPKPKPTLWDESKGLD